LQPGRFFALFSEDNTFIEYSYFDLNAPNLP